MIPFLKINRLFKNGHDTSPEKIRGVPDSRMKFVSTSNLWLIAMARLMEAEGVDDQPLIDELYKRGRSEVTK